jgi:hypothetical protein
MTGFDRLLPLFACRQLTVIRNNLRNPFQIRVICDS